MADSVPSLERETAIALVNEVFNFDYLRFGFEIAEAEIASLLATTAFSSRSDEFPFSEQDEASLEERVKRILSVRKSLSLTAKTIDVMSDQDRAFIKARVLTDFRPVFAEDLSRVDAGVIVHTLTIHFAQDGDHKDFYVAMDTADVKKLRDALDRADKKAQMLETMVREAKVSYISAT